MYHIAHQSIRQIMKQAGRNLEMPNFTQATHDAREIAIARMQSRSRTGPGDRRCRRPGERDTQVWGEHGIESLAMGTSCAECEHASTPSRRPWCSASRPTDIGPRRPERTWGPAPLPASPRIGDIDGRAARGGRLSSRPTPAPRVALPDELQAGRCVVQPALCPNWQLPEALVPSVNVMVSVVGMTPARLATPEASNEATFGCEGMLVTFRWN